MGDVMFFGILRMPYNMAMANEISRHQYWQSVQQAADEIERLREALNEAETICLAQYVTLMCAGENEKASNVKKVADKLTTLLKKESE